MMKRVLIKLSGEALGNPQDGGFNLRAIDQICTDIANAHHKQYQIGIVIGAGNVGCRGSVLGAMGIDPVSADYVGMMATVMNGIVLQSKLQSMGIGTKICSSIFINSVSEIYDRYKVIRHMEKGKVVIFTCGTGQPFFTTDTAAVLRAAETACDAVLKGTQVDGVYCSDPKINTGAKRYDSLTYDEAIERELGVVDKTALFLAAKQRMPIVVFNIHIGGNLLDVLENKGKFSIISSKMS